MKAAAGAQGLLLHTNHMQHTLRAWSRQRGRGHAYGVVSPITILRPGSTPCLAAGLGCHPGQLPVVGGGGAQGPVHQRGLAGGGLVWGGRGGGWGVRVRIWCAALPRDRPLRGVLWASHTHEPSLLTHTENPPAPCAGLPAGQAVAVHHVQRPQALLSRDCCARACCGALFRVAHAHFCRMDWRAEFMHVARQTRVQRRGCLCLSDQ